ncbi:MAG TPA: helix-turn-helix domain-containing protein [Candidatus Didemnitutus sp.]|nr:helix-turn-helix domain-containing protein [Candidatus Didemnitutus sp.]
MISSAHPGPLFLDPTYAVSTGYSRFIHTTMLVCMGIFAVQIPIYLGRCRRLLANRFAEETRQGQGTRTRAWVQLPLLIVFTTWASGILRTLDCVSHAPQEIEVVISFIDVSVAVGSIYAILRRISVPEPFVEPSRTSRDVSPFDEGLPAALPPAPLLPLPSAVPEPEAEIIAPTIIAEKPRYARSKLPEVLRARIRRKLESAMADQRLLADSLLNLRSLSEHLREKPHYVSQVINQDLGSTFYAYVNRHRIERARILLREDPAKTILEVALEVGFNSKSTFNAAFRGQVGMTPKAFRLLGSQAAGDS